MPVCRRAQLPPCIPHEFLDASPGHRAAADAARQERAMTRPVTAWLLPLTLLLDAAAAAQTLLKVTRLQEVSRPGQEMRLKCEVSSTASVGCSWLRHRPDGPPTFLLYISKTRAQQAYGSKTERFWGEKDKDTFIFILRDFSPDDQGHYFCSAIINSQMHFSPLVRVFLPAQPTTRPAPPPTPRVSNEPHTRSLRPEPCRPGAGGAVEKRGLDFDCDIYILAPLAGVCAVLLLSLVVTVICYHKNRRRVCKCPRPVVRQGGKPSPSGKYV